MAGPADASQPPVRWGFLGAGAIAARALAPAVHATPAAQLYAVASRDPARAAALGPERVHDDYAALLADEDVEVVYVALPNSAHHRWTLAAVRAGRHVLCEKPFALSAAEVDAVAAERGDRVVVEAMWFRWHPRLTRLQELLADGAVGAVREVWAGFTFRGVAPGDYRLDPAMGGGALYDLGGYVVSATLLAFAGRPVQEIRARCRPGPTGVDLAADLELHLDGGRAQLHVAIDEADRQWLSVLGDRGRIDLPDAPFTAWWATAGSLELHRGADLVRERVPAVDAYTLMVAAVGAAARGGDSWVLPLADSRQSAAVLDAARASAMAGCAGWVRPTPG